MDDIIRSSKTHFIEAKLREIDNFIPFLKFVDMTLIRTDGKLFSTWYTKSTDTGVTEIKYSLEKITPRVLFPRK